MITCDAGNQSLIQVISHLARTWRHTYCTWNVGSTDPRWNEIADLQPIIARSASAVTPSEKSSINANRKSTTQCVVDFLLALIVVRTTRFPMSLRWSSYVAPKSPKGGLKNVKRPICEKNALRLKKVCYKVSLCENCQRQSCKALIALTVRAKMVGGSRPLLPEILSQSDRVGAKFEQ